MLRIDAITIFPEMFPSVLQASILKRAQEGGYVQVAVHDLRDYTHDKRRTVDDRPYGGGPGMVLRPEPLFEAVEAIEARSHPPGTRTTTQCQIVLMAPTGALLTHARAQALAQRQHLVILCGHYEGVDERVRQALVDQDISIGDYVLTGGELPALVLIDGVVRLIPGVLGHASATADDSFTTGQLEHPHYTRPEVFRGMGVPPVLRSGDHQQITTWRKLKAFARTWSRRPDLLEPPSRHQEDS